MPSRSFAVLCTLLLLSGCAALEKGGISLGLSFSYESALKDFERGRIMQARRKALSVKPEHEDYARAQALLKEKIEPARKRLLNHYVDRARAAEKRDDWQRAMERYGQAAELALKPKRFEALRDLMEVRVRQVRMNALLALRRREDAAILGWRGLYEVPHGVSPKDFAYRRMREDYDDLVDDRADDALSEARYYLRREMPGVAFVHVESFLRFRPDDARGRELKERIREAMPEGFYIPGPTAFEERPAPEAPPETRPSGVTRVQVEASMEADDWHKARELARAYWREGGEGSDALLKRVEARVAERAARLFEKGRVAFRREELDKAVEFWREAVRLAPRNEEYLQSLNRAEQLQERLRVLRGGEGE